MPAGVGTFDSHNTLIGIASCVPKWLITGDTAETALKQQLMTVVFQRCFRLMQPDSASRVCHAPQRVAGKYRLRNCSAGYQAAQRLINGVRRPGKPGRTLVRHVDAILDSYAESVKIIDTRFVGQAHAFRERRCFAMYEIY